MEWTGTPIDVKTLNQLREHWTEMQGRLIQAVDAQYHVYDGTKFKIGRWAEYLAAHNIPWPAP